MYLRCLYSKHLCHRIPSTSFWILQQIGCIHDGQISFEVFEQGLAPLTWKTYAAASKRFYNFCTRFQLISPFPVSENTLCCFAAFLADESLAQQTAKAYLSASQILGTSPLFWY
jgi:hypothetical protein